VLDDQQRLRHAIVLLAHFLADDLPGLTAARAQPLRLGQLIHPPLAEQMSRRPLAAMRPIALGFRRGRRGRRGRQRLGRRDRGGGKEQ
jgi:hypothetical protein